MTFNNLLYMHIVASQMKTLIRLLPLIVGDYIPQDDEHWACFLMLWDICTSITAFEVDRQDAMNLAWTIEAFMESLEYLYSESIFTPKLHYLLHLPGDMLRYTCSCPNL